MSYLLLPERSMSPVYQDDRWKEKFAFNIRHGDTTGISRYRNLEAALRDQAFYAKAGYTLVHMEQRSDYDELVKRAETAEAEAERYRKVLQRIANRRPNHYSADTAFYRCRQDAKDALK